MDLLGLVDLVRLGSVSSGLRDGLQAPTRQLAMEHCRVASGRANRSEAHLQDFKGMMVEVASQRDAAETALDASDDARALAEDRRDAAEQELDAARGRIRELELELADAKRARR